MKPQDKARSLRPLIEKASASLSDEDALNCVEFFKRWAAGIWVERFERLEYKGNLYRVEQDHTTQAEYTPDITPSLYSEVGKPGQGDTPDNPIPYNNNMELIKDKYYSQDEVIYVCFRDSGIPVYNDLVDLVGLYVNVWEGLND
ncbi:MAG: hypothetical protein J6S67_03455 [Methanobrevibacter sp.]|nr:hypothetical protein [Methanobrevibacter sp.]